MTDTDRESLSIRRVLEKSGMDLSDSVYEESAKYFIVGIPKY